eukprot:SAG22_NODE_12931_length_424_cov_1.101538_1_plen_57_part_10
MSDQTAARSALLRTVLCGQGRHDRAKLACGHQIDDARTNTRMAWAVRFIKKSNLRSR